MYVFIVFATSHPPILLNLPIFQPSNHPILKASDLSEAECAERLNPPHPCRRVKCLTKACMQNSAKTRRVKHANATPLTPRRHRALRRPAHLFVFFVRFVSHCKFSCKKMRSKIAKIADPGFLASLKGRKKNKKVEKTRK